MAKSGGSLASVNSRQSDEDSSAGDFLRELAFAPPAVPPALERDRSGEALGRFQLKKLLGRGGMGEVYEAFDQKLRRKVALKLLRADAVGSEERQRRFVREARAAAAVSHPNIAAVFEVGEAAGEVFIALEFVDGHSLRASLEQAGAALPRPEALRVVREVSRGLAAAHAAGIVHRDLKPENVMLGHDGRVKVLDFGLAKLCGAPNAPDAPTASAITTRAGRILGSPAYMSPEQARGLPTDARSDVFSLGVMLFELLAGMRPFRGPTTMDILTAILRDEAPALAGGPDPLGGVVARCLSKEPGDRYADAGELLGAFEAAVSTGAPSDSATRPPARLSDSVMVPPSGVAAGEASGPPARAQARGAFVRARAYVATFAVSGAVALGVILAKRVAPRNETGVASVSSVAPQSEVDATAPNAPPPSSSALAPMSAASVVPAPASTEALASPRTSWVRPPAPARPPRPPARSAKGAETAESEVGAGGIGGARSHVEAQPSPKRALSEDLYNEP